MTSSSEEPTAAATAAAVAPLIDRVRLSIMNRALAVGFPDSVQAAGLDPATAMLFAYLRNAWPDRVVGRSSVRAVFTYQPDKPIDALLDALVALSVLEEPEPGLLRLTDLGRELVTELSAVSTQAAEGLWADDAARVSEVAPLVRKALMSARQSGGEAFALMAPDEFPAQTPVSAVLAEQLTGLRFHRFDAHIAAWRAADYSVADLEGLDEQARATLEADTNERAALPYAALTPAERGHLIEVLESLPY